MLYAIPDVGDELAVVHFNGDLNLHFPFGSEQQPPHIFREVQFVGAAAEIELDCVRRFHVFAWLLKWQIEARLGPNNEAARNAAADFLYPVFPRTASTASFGIVALLDACIK